MKATILILALGMSFGCSKKKEETPAPTKNYTVVFYAYPKGTTSNYGDLNINLTQGTGNNYAPLLGPSGMNMSSATYTKTVSTKNNDVLKIDMSSNLGNNDVGVSISTDAGTVFQTGHMSQSAYHTNYTVKF